MRGRQRAGADATTASLLGLLNEGPMTGWDLVTRAQERISSFAEAPRAWPAARLPRDALRGSAAARLVGNR